MPVEESGNMIILADAISQEEGNTQFVDQWWPQGSRKWAKYLEQYGLDPEEQLCTDDFKGRLAHNANLSVKAIVALAAYGDMARIKGDNATAARYLKLAKRRCSALDYGRLRRRSLQTRLRQAQHLGVKTTTWFGTTSFT